MATTGKSTRKGSAGGAGRTLERILGVFEVFAGYGTKRSRPRRR